MTDEIAPKTKISADLKTMVFMVGTLLTGAFFAGQTYYALMQRISLLDARVSEVVTRRDLISAQEDFARKLAIRLGAGPIVECPRHVPKGEAVARCKLIMPLDQ